MNNTIDNTEYVDILSKQHHIIKKGTKLRLERSIFKQYIFIDLPKEVTEKVISDKLQTGITSCITQLSCGSSTQTIHLSFNIVGEFKIKIRKDASNIGKTLKLESDSEQEIKVTVVEDVSLWIKIKKLIN